VAAIAVTIAGAAYAQATLGRVPYDEVASTITALGWTTRDGIVVSAPNGGTQISSPVGWYLPGHPTLVWRRGRRNCLTRFAIVQLHNPRAWLAGRALSRARVFAYYDHPILGRPRGKLVVAGLSRPTRVRGAFFYTLGRKVPCS
jgi:hypothetical protein